MQVHSSLIIFLHVPEWIFGVWGGKKKYLQVFSLEKEIQAWGSGGWYWEVSCQLIICQIQPVEFGEFTQWWRYLTSEVVRVESPERERERGKLVSVEKIADILIVSCIILVDLTGRTALQDCPTHLEYHHWSRSQLEFWKMEKSFSYIENKT